MKKIINQVIKNLYYKYSKVDNPLSNLAQNNMRKVIKVIKRGDKVTGKLIDT